MKVFDVPAGCTELPDKHQDQENRSSAVDEPGWQQCKKETFTEKPDSKMGPDLNSVVWRRTAEDLKQQQLHERLRNQSTPPVGTNLSFCICFFFIKYFIHTIISVTIATLRFNSEWQVIGCTSPHKNII